ncbi:hypothetical protein A374_05901 [Fictibacillus macauensis ZFHKF-1]|uniref:Uncharacterized protein n=1 Tax=Fictibacillus macauensis ZFHKF-1 TaxID=1196324 RepID=I8AKW5_9BACL|nr:hypothetical protein [Fictibacillus macauensis]EIT86472.1 hypothetical protein A374_05901 [Fictibacillus macauensis ZFHKF-1]
MNECSTCNCLCQQLDASKRGKTFFIFLQGALLPLGISIATPPASTLFTLVSHDASSCCVIFSFLGASGEPRILILDCRQIAAIVPGILT